LGALGALCLSVGIVGIVIPALPTTPLVLLASICFSTANPKIYRWLAHSRLFGPYIDNYRTGRGISLRRKMASIAFLWAGLLTSMAMVRTWLVCLVLAIVGVGISLHLCLIKTKKK